MTDEEEFAARSQLKWARDGKAWILLHRKRKMGRVAPGDYPLNISRAKDLVLAKAVREVAYELSCKPSAKPQQLEGSFQKKSSLVDLNR